MIEQTIEQLEKMFKIPESDLKDINFYQVILNDLWTDNIGDGKNPPKKIEGKIGYDILPKKGEHDSGFKSTYFFGIVNKKYRKQPNLSTQVDYITEDVKLGLEGGEPKVTYFEVETTYRNKQNFKLVIDNSEEKLKISMKEIKK